MFVRRRLPQAAEENDHPDQHADGEEDLPQPAEVQVFPALCADPKPGAFARDVAFDARRLAEQTADDDEDHRAEQSDRELVLVLGLASRDHGRQENSHGQKTG